MNGDIMSNHTIASYEEETAMSQYELQFRTALLGGYEKRDVITFLEKNTA